MTRTHHRELGELRELANGFAARIRLGPQPEDRKEYELVTCGRDRAQARVRCTALGLLAVQMRKANVSIHDMEVLLAKSAKTTDAAWRFITEGVARICADGRTALITNADIPTFEAHANSWIDGTLHEKFPDHVALVETRRSEELLRIYVIPVMGKVLVTEVTVDDGQRVLSELRERAHAARIARKQNPKDPSPETRRKVAKVINRVMALAVMPCRYIPFIQFRRDGCRANRKANARRATFIRRRTRR